MTLSRRSLLALSLSTAIGLALPSAFAADSATYFPPAGEWARRDAAQLGMDPAALAAAVQFAQSHETDWPLDLSTQETIFGERLGSMPTRRAHTNGVVIYKGYVVAEFGDTRFVDPTYSVAKSMLATVAGIAVRDGRIKVDERVAERVKDGGYDAPQNAPITWKHHLQQESEWEGTLWGKHSNFIGKAAFGKGERKPRALQAPGSFYEYNDTRINRFALSLLNVFGQSVPDVFQQQIMEPIGGSSSWKWLPYHNSYVELNGKQVPSVSGGTRWGGGMWIDSWDMARFGYLWLHQGAWNGKRILPASYVKDALTPSAHGPDYGYLWWLNTKGKNLPGLPANAFAALGAGSNTIVVSPDHDLVVVWRWHSGNTAEFTKRVIAAIRK